MTRETRMQRRADLLWRRSLDAVLVVPPGADEPITLAGTGPELWDLLETPRSLPELVRELAARHQASSDLVEADVSPVIDQLLALGVLERMTPNRR